MAQHVGRADLGKRRHGSALMRGGGWRIKSSYGREHGGPSAA